MATLPKVQFEREEFCRFDDYGRYAKHLSRKIHTLRKSVEKKQDVLLFCAERTWANAMQNKSLSGKVQITLNKLRKSCKHAKDLVASHETSSAEERLQTIIYEDYLQGTLAQERGAYEVAILHFSRALIALQNQKSSLMESVETGLRFSIYQSGAEERSINLQKFALNQVGAEETQAWRTLVNEVSPASLNEEKGEEMITSIQWASRSAHLTNPDLATSISTAVSGQSSLTSDSPPNAFDAILAAWSTASLTINQLLEKEEDQNLSQDLELTKAWISYHSQLDRIARDKSLIKTTSPRDGVILSDSIIRLYAQTLAIPGLDVSQREELDQARRDARGDRCALLARSYGTSLESIALLDRARSYYAPDSPRAREVVDSINLEIARYSLSNSHAPGGSVGGGVRVVKESWFSGDPKQLGVGRGDQSAHTGPRSVPMKPVVFDIAWNYITASAQQQPASSASPLGVGTAGDQSGVKAGGGDSATTEGDDLRGAQMATPVKKGGLFGGLFGGR